MTPPDGDLRALVRYLEDGIEAERTRLARTLHDDMAQGVTALRFDLERLVTGLVRGAETGGLAAEAQSTVTRLDDLMRAIRRTMADLRPAVLDQVGLRAALEWRLRLFEQRTGIAAELDAAADPPVSGDRATRVYRIVSDELARLERAGSAALVSLTLHPGAARCRIELTAHEYVAAPEDPEHAMLALQFHERTHELGGQGTIEQHGSTRVVAFGVSLVAGEHP
jgi:two-component system, NarL family, sensor histidine kinase UhpB